MSIHPVRLRCGKDEGRILNIKYRRIFSEPLINEFESKTGIKVKAVYDVEATKTTGLVNPLIAEKKNPQADVFWNSEVGRTILLKNEGVLTRYQSVSAKNIPDQFKDPASCWTGFAARARKRLETGRNRGYSDPIVPICVIPGKEGIKAL